MQKGQYRILNEVFVFALGIAILSFVIISFGSVQDNLNLVLLENNMEAISDVFSIGIIKASMINSSIRTDIPPEFLGHQYIISIDGNIIKLTSMKNPSYIVSKELFNMNETHNIKGDIISSGEFFLISSVNNNIVIKRKI